MKTPAVIAAAIAVSVLCAAPAMADPANPAPPGPGMINPVEPTVAPYDQPGTCEFSAGVGPGASCASEPTDDLMFGLPFF